MRSIRASVNVLITVLGVLLFTGALMASMAATTTDVAVASTTTGSGMFNPSARLDTSTIDDLRTAATDTATDDATAEGRDVLPTSYHHAPADLWKALRQAMPDAYEDDVPGIGTFYPPVGSVVEGDTAKYLATLDGWAQIHETRADGVFVVTMLDIPTDTASVVYADDPAALAADRASAALGTMLEGATTAAPVQLSPRCVRAARDILHASLSRHLRVEEDLSYRGAPRRVGQCNDLLAEAYFTDGRQMVNGRHDHQALRTFLRTVIRTGELPAVSSSVRV